MNRPRTAIEYLENRVLRGTLLLILVLAAVMPSLTRCRAGETKRHKALQKVAREWMQVGTEQHKRSLSKAAEKSFRRAAVYRKYLTDAERKKLNELIEKPANVAVARGRISVGAKAADSDKVVALDTRAVEVKSQAEIAEVEADSIRDSDFLSTKEWDYIIEKPETAARSLGERIRRYDPHSGAMEIAVAARSFYNLHVFVTGQVRKPGVLQLPQRLTVLEAIMGAGGFDLQEAERSSVIVIRYLRGRRYAYKLDLRQSASGKETKPFYLQRRDIVHVPRTGIAQLNQWIDQHIDKIISDTGRFLRKTSGDTTVSLGSDR